MMLRIFTANVFLFTAVPAWAFKFNEGAPISASLFYGLVGASIIFAIAGAALALFGPAKTLPLMAKLALALGVSTLAFYLYVIFAWDDVFILRSTQRNVLSLLFLSGLAQTFTAMLLARPEA